MIPEMAGVCSVAVPPETHNVIDTHSWFSKFQKDITLEVLLKRGRSSGGLLNTSARVVRCSRSLKQMPIGLQNQRTWPENAENAPPGGKGKSRQA